MAKQLIDEGTDWPAPGKLNLFLHITGRRADGYHLLQTVFQFLDFGDTLQFKSLPRGVIHRSSGPEGVAEAEDLCIRAALHLQRVAGLAREGVHIDLQKRLPMGGGLGGGSSDAATTLVALNILWGTGLSTDDLAEIALDLGADVPVFVYGQAAWAEGIGERLEVLDDLPEPWYVVIHPRTHVMTAKLFADPKLTRDCSPIKIPEFLAGRGGNVFEPLVREYYLEIDKAFDFLDVFSKPRLTGTGACLFSAFADKAQAESVVARAAGKWTVFLAKGCNRSPLRDRLLINGE